MFLVRGPLRTALVVVLRLLFGAFTLYLAATAAAVADPAPEVSAVAVPLNGTYHAGDILDFIVRFTSAVSVTGTPQLRLQIGSTSVAADYFGGSGTDYLDFSYSVVSGDNDADGIVVSGLVLNGGTIRDAGDTDALLTLNNVASTAGVLVNAIVPTVALTTTAPPVGGSTITATAVFSEAVTGFSLGGILATNATLSDLQTSDNITYTFQVTVNSPGMAAVEVLPNAAVNGADNGNQASNTLTYTYAEKPTISSVSPNTGPAAGGTSVTISGSGFLEPVTVTFGGASATAVTVVSPTEITATTPAGTPGGTVDVVVSAPGGDATATGAFSYAALLGTLTVREVTDGRDGSFGFTVDPGGTPLAIATVNGAGSAAPLSLTAGSYTVTAQNTGAAGFGLTNIACSDADSSGDVGSRTAHVVLEAGEDVTCTFSSVDSRDTTTGLIQNFFDARADLILANQPDAQRRIDRLNGIVDEPANPVSALMGYLPSLADGTAGLPTINASLAGINALTGRPTSRFDAWFQSTLGLYSDDHLSGKFGIVSAGADYLVSKDLLLGGFIQADIMPDASSDQGGTIGGTGWLAGPYATLRLADDLYLDVLAGAGKSYNQVNPYGGYTDSFDATRWLASAALTGQFSLGDWSIEPTARLSYYQETSAGYVDSLGVDIPAVTAGLGQAAVGPRIAYRFTLDNGVGVVTAVRLDGLADIKTDDAAAGIDDLRGRVEGTLDVSIPGGATIGASAAYDGIGSSSISATSGSLRLAVPMK